MGSLAIEPDISVLELAQWLYFHDDSAAMPDEVITHQATAGRTLDGAQTGYSNPYKDPWPENHPARVHSLATPIPANLTENSNAMKIKLNSLLPGSCAAVALVALSLLSSQSMAHEYRVGDIEVVHPIAPPTPPGAGMAAGYVEIINHGDQDDRLMGGKVFFAHEMQIHQTEVIDDVSRMRQIEDGLLIPAGATVKLEPMGTHLMFTELAEPLVEGGRHPATLSFEKAGDVEVEFAIEYPNSDSMKEMHGDDMKMDEEGTAMKGMKHH